MASSSKKRTTMAKIARENKLRERRLDKQARKDARKNATDEQPLDGEATPHSWLGEPADSGAPESPSEHDDAVDAATPSEPGTAAGDRP
jgi:hypothetical protein